MKGDFFMRSYMEKKEETALWVKPLKIIIVIVMSILVMFLLTVICSAIILNSGLPESSAEIMMIIVSAVTSMLMAVLLTRVTDSKAIMSALYSFLVMLGLKLILTNILAESISFGRQGIVGIIFSVVFCVIGSLIGANIKK